MNEEMLKSLVALVDESLAELEELKKSDRFSASEIKLDGPGKGIDGKDPNGSLGKEEDKKDDEDEDEKKDKKDMDKAEDKSDKKDEDKEMDKAEGKNSEADPNAGKHQVVKGEMSAGPSDGSSQGSAAGKNSEADPNAGKHQVVKKEDDEDEEKKKKEKEEMKKSQEALVKSYVDERLSPIESKLETIAKLVQEIADTPVPRKSVDYKTVAPLKKSADEESNTLSKSEVINKLFELKKSGTRVDTVDIASAELASGADLVKIATKYNIK